MSVLVKDRKESKFEAITFSIELHNMLIELMQRSFGVKDLDHFVRLSYYEHLLNKSVTIVNKKLIISDK